MRAVRKGATDRPISWYIVFESAALYDFMLRGTMVTLSPVHPDPLGCAAAAEAAASREVPRVRPRPAAVARVLGYELEGA